MDFIVSLFILASTAHGVPFMTDTLLTERAQIRAENLCNLPWEHGNWTHSFKGAPDGQFIGENLIKDFETGEKAHEALMASPTHRANIVNKHFKYLGIGRATCQNGEIITVELFIGPLPLTVVKDSPKPSTVFFLDRGTKRSFPLALGNLSLQKDIKWPL